MDNNSLELLSQDQAENLPHRIQRYSIWKQRSTEMAAWLKDRGEVVLHGRQVECGNYLLFRNYYLKGVVRLVKAFFCKNHHLCPLCGVRRAGRLLRLYEGHLKLLLSQTWSHEVHLSLVTLTVKNGDDLSERFAHLVRSISLLGLNRRVSKVRKKKKREWDKLLGAVWSYEVTKKDKGWHPHAHFLVMSSALLIQQNLVEDWRRITKDSFIVDVRPILHPDNPIRDLLEVFKYTMKFSELSLADNFLAYKVLKGRRLICSSGIFRGVQEPECLLDEEIKDQPYVELLYNFIQCAGYSLTTHAFNRAVATAERPRSERGSEAACTP